MLDDFAGWFHNPPSKIEFRDVCDKERDCTQCVFHKQVQEEEGSDFRKE